MRSSIKASRSSSVIESQFSPRSAHRRRNCSSPSAKMRCHQASRAAFKICSTARCRSGGNCIINCAISSSDSSSFGIAPHLWLLYPSCISMDEIAVIPDEACWLVGNAKPSSVPRKASMRMSVSINPAGKLASAIALAPCVPTRRYPPSPHGLPTSQSKASWRNHPPRQKQMAIRHPL